MGVTSVQPYWDLTFDAGGDPDPKQRDALLAQAAEHTDLVVFAHGWNNDLSGATRLYDRFYGPFPGLLAGAKTGVRLGYVGLHWPSMRFSDEPIPDLPRPALAPRGAGVDEVDVAALKRVLPGHDAAVDRIAELLARQPEDTAALDEFARLVRTVTGCGEPAAAALAADAVGGAPPPALLAGDPEAACQELAEALASVQGGGEALFGGPFGELGKKVWSGARELLRQATYFAMKGRAGTVGRAGLGPFLGLLAREAPDTRVHLVGHSFGARLVSFALAGLPSGARDVASVTLLQGAFSHSAYAPAGALAGMQRRVAGPVVACYSSHDTALCVFYPLASRLSGDDRSLLGDDRWGALGHDGFHGMKAVTTTLAAAPGARFAEGACVSVDASAVVRSGGPPSGAHSDICHPELARLALHAAGLLG